MSDIILYIGNKNLSSWSLRPWLLMRQAGIEFEERLVRLDVAEERASLGEISPSAQVPALVHAGQTIWDSMAIAEYLNEQFPAAQLWPAERQARAAARCVSMEMHAGFSNLRQFWPMNFSRANMNHLCPPPVHREALRIVEIWTMCRKRFGNHGPFLFGQFSIADAMYAPVVSRFRTYGPLDLNEHVVDYCQTVWTLPAMRAWGEDAKRELAGEAI
ncbi:MAG: glutathione S-transferase family protein [Pseudomonadota bacterium]